jgi:PTH1 family peptidyl-tRNA hydrolase
MADLDWMIVGLGNPGATYQSTRHNAGFLALDRFAEKTGCCLENEKWQGQYCRTTFSGNSLLLIKPQTYMNRSGECVVRFRDFYKIALERILILHDDLDLPTDRIKIVTRGGAGGHNGIRSLINHFGSSDFARIKIGIGRPPLLENGQSFPVERYVLTNFSREERLRLHEKLELVNEAIELFVRQGAAVAMNRINGS